MKSENNKYINREISWLSFNERVLQEAADPEVPLIERTRRCRSSNGFVFWEFIHPI